MTETWTINCRMRFALSSLDDLVSKTGGQCDDVLLLGFFLEVFGTGFVGGGCHADGEEKSTE